MSLRQFAARLKGVFGFPVTPFRSDLTLDLEALAHNADEMASHPFCAIVAAGGTGELYSLSPDEVEAVVRTTVEAVNGRMPVVAGTGFNTAIGVEIAQRVQKAGADFLLVLPPYYVMSPEAGLFAYYNAIAESTTLPVMVYSRDWAVFTPEMVSRLADLIPNLVAWKDGQGDIRKLQRIMAYNGDRLAWYGGLGDDCAAGYFALGVQAYTSSISNIAPQLSVDIAQAGMAQDFTRLNELLNRYVHPLYAFRERARGYEVAAMKAAMEILGKTAGPVRPPLTNVRDQDLPDLRAIVSAYIPNRTSTTAGQLNRTSK